MGQVQLLSRAFSTWELALLILWILLGKARLSDSGDIVESMLAHSRLLPWFDSTAILLLLRILVPSSLWAPLLRLPFTK